LVAVDGVSDESVLVGCSGWRERRVGVVQA
jgi:hypothetical protein